MVTKPRNREQAEIDRAVDGLTLVDVLGRNARERGNLGALRWRKGDGWETLTWSGYRDAVIDLAAGLIDLGLSSGETVGIMAGNRPEHLIADLAIIHAGGIPVSFYPTMAPPQLAAVMADCGARIVFVESAELLARLDAAAAPKLEHVIMIDPAPDATERTVSIGNLRSRGVDRLFNQPTAVDARAARVEASDPATLIYTSGTSGDPKGVVLSHRATIWTNESADRYLRSGAEALGLRYPRHRRMVSYLPLAHIAERQVTHYAALYGGNEVTFCSDVLTLPSVLAETRPHLFAGVPRVWEKVKSRLEERIAETPSRLRRRMALSALRVGVDVAKAEEAGRQLSRRTRITHWLLDRLILHRVRSALGLDELIIALCGAAHVDPDVIWFFRGLGLPLYEAYGLSETTGYGTANAPGASRVGSIGRALPGIELATDTDGEIMLRGGMLAAGYLRNPTATAAAFDQTGWLRTGDVGSISPDGYLTLLGRKKEILITSGGQNVAPAPIERRLEQHPLIAHACLIGDARRYVGALLTVDWEEAETWAGRRGLQTADRDTFVGHSDVLASVRRWVESTNEGLSRPEQIKDFHLLAAEWTVERGEITPTLKTVRHVIAQRFIDEIEALYE